MTEHSAPEQAMTMPAELEGTEPLASKEDSNAWQESSAPSEQDWYWAPLLESVGVELSAEFEWRAETDTIQTYEHRETHRYVHIDSVSRQFYNQARTPISQEAALAHVLPVHLDPPVEAKPEPRLDEFMRRTEVDSSPRRKLDLWGKVTTGIQHARTTDWSSGFAGVLNSALQRLVPGHTDGAGVHSALTYATPQITEGQELSLHSYIRQVPELEG